MAAPQILSYSTRSEAAAATTLTAVMPTGVTAGDRLVVILASNIRITLLAPSGYTNIGSARGVRPGDDFGGSMIAFTKVAGASEPDLAMAVEAGRHLSIVLRYGPDVEVEASGAQSTTGSAGTYPTNTALDPVHPALTLSQSREYSILAPWTHSRNDNTTWTPPSGFSSVAFIPFVQSGTHGYPMMGVSKRDVTATGSYSVGTTNIAEETTNVNRYWVAGAIALYSTAVISRSNKLMGGL